MKNIITAFVLVMLFVTPAYAQMAGQLQAQGATPGNPIMAGQAMPGQFVAVPNQGVAMNPGAYQAQFQGTGDVPAWAIQRGQLCGTDRFANTNQFNFGAAGAGGPGSPGIHQ